MFGLVYLTCALRNLYSFLMLSGELKPLVPRRHFYAGKKSIIEHVCFISFQDKKRTVLTADTINHIFLQHFLINKNYFFPYMLW